MFTVVDLKWGYWPVRIDEDSSLKTTFNTPFRRCRWLRLPFDLNISAEIVQQKLHQALDWMVSRVWLMT